MPLNETQADFIKTYLGVTPKAAADAGTNDTSPTAPLDYWNSGKETADRAITALQKSLKGLGNPDLDKIAEFGLHGAMEGQQTKLMAALMDHSKSNEQNRAKTAQKVIDQCKSYKAVLESNTVIKLCEANPFGIKADIRGPLKTALKRIEDACAA